VDSQRWNEVARIFSDAIEIRDRDAQSEFIARHSFDAAMEAEVRSLLANSEDGETLDTPALGSMPTPVTTGEMVGPYRILREIGRGGMGLVYEAERADGQFERRVALKFVGGPMLTDLLRRFQLERRILASLEHPNITRLLDAGLSASGLPYLVIEYVNGVPITQYCQSKKLPLRERLELFRTVCVAVHHAHQRMIIHRDLKPNNILVESNGTPRLLDFGIARLLEETADERTVAGFARFTLNYASPEQIRGERLSTASDIYSLGVLLYTLLTDDGPYDLSASSLSESTRKLSELRIKPPSEHNSGVLSRQLKGDLDAIVLKALSADARERYASADEFARDIQRYLRAEPIAARPPLWIDHSRKFIRRHTFAVAAASAAAIVLLAATGVALYQARSARLERERTLQQLSTVRELANSLLFDYQQSLATIAGTLDVRRQMIDKARTHLERLTAETSALALRLDIATAWQRLGQVQGDSDWSLGDGKAAMASYGQATAILNDILKEHPEHQQAAIERLDVTARMAVISKLSGAKDEYQALASEKRRQLEPLLRRYPNDIRVLRVAAADPFWRSAESTDRKERLRYTRESLAAFEKILRLSPQDEMSIYNVALLSKSVAGTLGADGHLEEALPHALRAEDLERRLLERNPKDPKRRLDHTFTQSTIASIYNAQKRFSQGFEMFEKMLATRRELFRQEPVNDRLRSSLISGLQTYGGALVDAGERQRARKQFLECVELLKNAPDNGRYRDARDANQWGLNQTAQPSKRKP